MFKLKALVVFVIFYCLAVSAWKFFHGSELWAEQYAVSKLMVSDDQWYRLAFGPFAHDSLLHLWLNLYALYYFLWNVKPTADRRWHYILVGFITSIPLAAVSFAVFSASGYSMGISGGVLAILGFLFIADENYDIAKGLVFIFLFGSLMPHLVDNISHATGFIFGMVLGKLYLKGQVNSLGQVG